MASKSDPDIPASLADSTTPRQSRRRTQSVPASPGGAQQEDGGSKPGQMEQFQISESPQHEAAGRPARRSLGRTCFLYWWGDSDRKKGTIILAFLAVALIVVVGMLINNLINESDGWTQLGGPGTFLRDAEWDTLKVDLVFPGDPDYIEPTRPEVSEYIEELVKEYPWQSRACGMSFRNLKTESSQNQNQDGRLNIIGSKALPPGQFPWNLVILQQPKETGILQLIPYCGATLVSSHFAVTATHCLPDFGRYEESPNVLWVVGGAVRLDQLRLAANREHQMRRVTRVYFHPKFPKRVIDGRIERHDNAYDVGVLRWTQPFRRLHTREGLVVLSPACLPSSSLVAKYNLTYQGEHLWSGMGENADPRTYGLSDRMRYGRFKFEDKCNARWAPSDHYLVACKRSVLDTSEATICGGDSGSSVNTLLLDPANERYFLSGIVSFFVGNTCRDSRYGGAVRVEAHMAHLDAIFRSYALDDDIY